MFKKNQLKILEKERGWAAIGSSVLTGILTAVGVTIGGLATKGITLGILIIGILLFANTLYGVFLGLGLRILNWGIGGPFGNMSMTNPANNQIISIGWTLLRDLTNMFFILGLAYIGLATALNIANFNTKKTFFALLLMAVLINFTPVICGLIVDGSNIIMNFFLSEVDFNQIVDSYKTLQPFLGLTNISEREAVDDIIPLVEKHTLFGVYAILAGFVMTVFGFILLLRHFIIWLLVVLSPLAFFCRIFDFSKKWFQAWWGHFISWSFVGIPAAFFLYLANHLMVLAKTKQIPTTDQANELGVGLTPYLITVLFMVIALISTLKIRAAGSGFIMSYANKVAGKAKSLPSLIQNKVGTPMGKNLGAKTGALLTGSAALFTKQGRANYRSAGGGAKGLAQAGVMQQREFQQARAKLQEKLGIKPRELEDLSEEELKRVAETPATTPDGLLRRAKAIKKLVDDDNFDASNPAKTTEMLSVMQQYPGMNIDKLKKAHPELESQIDPKGFQKEQDEITRAGTPLPAGMSLNQFAQFNIMKKRVKKMGAAEITNIPIEDMSLMDQSAIFAGITAGKIKKIGEEGRPERLAILKKFTGPGPEFTMLMNGVASYPQEHANIIATITEILSNPSLYP